MVYLIANNDDPFKDCPVHINTTNNNFIYKPYLNRST